MYKTLAIWTVALLLSASGASAYAEDCVVGFDGNDLWGISALSNLTYENQCLNFVESSNPYTRVCNASSEARVVTVVESFGSSYGHHHLGWEDTSINCFASDGCFGKSVGSSCQIVDHNRQERYISTHDGFQWIKVEITQPHSGARTTQQFKQIRVRSTADVWYRRASDKKWFVWRDLQPGLWNLRHNGTPVADLVALRQDSGFSYSVDDLRFAW